MTNVITRVSKIFKFSIVVEYTAVRIINSFASGFCDLRNIIEMSLIVTLQWINCTLIVYTLLYGVYFN